MVNVFKGINWVNHLEMTKKSDIDTNRDVEKHEGGEGKAAFENN